IFEPPDKKKARWRSIRLMYLTMFLSSVTFTISMASLWPYLQLVDRSATADFLGWVVAAYSIGQLVASPLFGFWANYGKSTRWPLVISILINILANVMYGYIESFDDHRDYYLLLSRAMVGFGAGNVAVVRSYVAGATNQEERTPVMANISIFQSSGFILGPGFQAALVPLGYPGPVHIAGFHFDLYTAPAFFSAIAGIINILLLLTIFKETRLDDVSSFSVQENETVELEPDYRPDYFAVISSITIFFVVLFIFTVFETIGSPLLMDMYGWSKSQATLYQGIILVGAGCEAIVVSLFVKALAKRFNERKLMLFGFITCLAGYFIFLPWGNVLPVRSVASDSSMLTDSSSPSTPLSTTSGPMYTNTTDNVTTTTVEPQGCPEYYSWCSYTPVIFLSQFLAGVACIGIGYPVAQIMSYTIYSKILGPKPQAVWMGWLTAAGSAARAIGPVFVTQIYNSYGPRVTFSACCGILLATILFICIISKRLVPFSVQTKLISPVRN
ncbi:hypothetical protein LOTGIDRAFT_138023, partial [Lottia gigantea]